MPVDYEFRRGPNAEGYPHTAVARREAGIPNGKAPPLRHMSALACVGPGGPEFDGYHNLWVAGSSPADAVRHRSSVG